MFVSGVIDALPKRYTNRICEGHEDLPSCKAILKAIKFEEKPSCKWTSESELKKIADTIIIQSNSLYPTLRMRGVG